MTTPVLEERGLVVPDGLFEIPDASPSGADFQIPSQFDNPRGQFHGTSTFGRSAREDAFSYLRSIGGGGAGGWEVACGGAARWCASGPGPSATSSAARRRRRSQEQYAMPRALDACYGSQFARAERFEKDPIDVRAVPGAYEDEIHFAKTTATTKAAGNAHKSYTIGERAARGLHGGQGGPTSYIDINGEGSFYYDVILAEKKRLQTRRPTCSAAPRDCGARTGRALRLRPCDPNAPPITDEARASLNLTCGYKAPPKTPGGRARKKAAPIVVSSEGVLAPKNLMGFPRPPNWLDYPSPAGDKILTMVSPARRDVRSSKSRRDLKSSTSQRRVHAADASAPVFMYYYVGIAVLKRLEEWHTGKTIYFLSMTLTTVGFGDVTPTTVAGKWFVIARARGHRGPGASASGADTRSLPIDESGRATRSRVVKYWKRYLLAAAPVALLLAGFVVGEMLDKYAALSAEDERAGAEPALSEADYAVATLVKADIVDDQILRALPAPPRTLRPNAAASLRRALASTSPGPRCDAVAREFADAAAAAATLESFCDDPPPRRHDDANRRTTGPRAVESACFGIFQEAHVSASPGDAALSRDMQASCCNYQILNRGRRNASAIIRGTIEDTHRYLMFPRSQIEAARHYAAASTRDVDLNFMGRLYDDDDGASLLDYALRKDYDPPPSRRRAACAACALVKRYFTADSVLLDTSVKDAASHVPLGAYDRSVGGDGRCRWLPPIAPTSRRGHDLQEGDLRPGLLRETGAVPVHARARATCPGLIFEAHPRPEQASAEHAGRFRGRQGGASARRLAEAAAGRSSSHSDFANTAASQGPRPA
ncbi:potassium channel [Aureococcus anophagefferens]|nr:potassium channel [Aureococcus anophagefferens]